VDLGDSSDTGCQPRSRRDLVRTFRSTPETKREPSGLASRAKLRMHRSALGGSM
jgi:hypothetical protein